MFEVGQKVKVIDQNPPAIGQVKKVSTWLAVLGKPAGDVTCYYVTSDEWQGRGSWLDAAHVEAIAEQEE